MKARLKKISCQVILIVCIMTASPGMANAPIDEEKKAASMYQKEYIAKPLFVFAMHNGGQYIFINAKKSTEELSKKSMDRESIEAIVNNTSQQNKNFSDRLHGNLIQNEVKEPELKFEQWMIENFCKVQQGEEKLEFEPWMMDQYYWKLKE